MFFKQPTEVERVVVPEKFREVGYGNLRCIQKRDCALDFCVRFALIIPHYDDLFGHSVVKSAVLKKHILTKRVIFGTINVGIYL